MSKFRSIEWIYSHYSTSIVFTENKKETEREIRAWKTKARELHREFCLESRVPWDHVNRGSRGERGRGGEERRERREEARRYISYARGEVRRRSGGELSTAKAAQGVVCPFTLPSPSAFFCRVSLAVLNRVFHQKFLFFFFSSSFVFIYWIVCKNS